MKALLLAILLALPFAALADGGKKPPIIINQTIVQQPAPESHATEAFWAGVAAGGLGITALQRTEHPWLYTVAGGIAASLVANAISLDAKETRAAILGVAVGATGTGLVFGRGFFGWQTAIKF